MVISGDEKKESKNFGFHKERRPKNIPEPLWVSTWGR